MCHANNIITLFYRFVLLVTVVLSGGNNNANIRASIVAATTPPAFPSTIDATSATESSSLVEELMGSSSSAGRSGDSRGNPFTTTSIHTESSDQPLQLLPLPPPMLGQPGGISTRLSSQCWRTGIEIIQQATTTDSSSSTTFQKDTTSKTHPPVTNAVSFCSNLTELQLKRLVLEITYCHMQDVDKAMYQSTSIQNLCTASSTTFVFMDMETIQMCLHHLTDIGYHTYTYFLPYVEMVCIRKTQELFHQYQYDTMNTVTKNYVRMTEQSIEQLRTNTEQVEYLWNIMTTIQEKLSNEIQDQFHSTKMGFDHLLQNQVQVWQEHMTDMMERIYVRDNEHQHHMDDWMQYQSSMLLQQSREMEYQKQLMYQHEAKVHQLAVTIQETAQVVQPIIQLQSIISLAKYSYHGISFLLHFVGTFNIVWILTRFQCCHSFRWYLFGIVGTEAIIEILLALAMVNDIIAVQDRKKDYTTYVTELRQWAMIIEVAVYVFGMIMSLLRYFVLYPTRKQKTRRRQHQEWLLDDGNAVFQNMIQQQQQQQNELHEFILSKQNKVTSLRPQMTRRVIPEVDTNGNQGQCHPTNQRPVLDTMHHPASSRQQLHDGESCSSRPNTINPNFPIGPHLIDINKSSTMIGPNLLSTENSLQQVVLDCTTTMHSVPSIHQPETPMSSRCQVSPVHKDRQLIDSNILMHSDKSMVAEEEHVPDVDPDIAMGLSFSRKRPGTDQHIEHDNDDKELLHHHPKRRMVTMTERGMFQ